MSSPPSSPTPSPSASLHPELPAQPRSQPMAIATPTPAQSARRFQPPIGSSSSPAFAPIPGHAPTSTYPQYLFKPKQQRPTVAAAPQTSANHSHPLQTSSRFNPIANPHASTPQSPHLTPVSPRVIDPSAQETAEAPARGRPMKRTAPLQIPHADRCKSPPGSEESHASTAGVLATTPGKVIASLPSSLTIPHSLPNLSPSYPATLFGGLSADDEHVTVWEPRTGKTVAGNAAPYRRNLSTWLKGHPGWEEKADELKSSKRRSAARRSKNAAESFASLCCYPVATFLANEAGKRLQGLGDGEHCNEEAIMKWTTDDFVRLQEALFRLGQEYHTRSRANPEIGDKEWANVTSQIGGSKMQDTVVYCAHHMLTRGISKSQKEISGSPVTGSFTPFSTSIPDIDASSASLSSHDIAGAGGPESFGGPSSLPTLQVGLGASSIERSFRAPREPRVTVWNPSNGRTISGNAAPCRRNLGAWMRQHPGWCPKEETQLSSSRRNRNRKGRPSSMPDAPDAPEAGPSSLEPESPHFRDALQGLLHLSKSPSAASPPNAQTANAQLEEQVARVEAEHGSPTSTHMDSVQAERGDAGECAEGPKKMGLTSSVSSSSAEDAGEMSDAEGSTFGKMDL